MATLAFQPHLDGLGKDLRFPAAISSHVIFLLFPSHTLPSGHTINILQVDNGFLTVTSFSVCRSNPCQVMKVSPFFSDHIFLARFQVDTPFFLCCNFFFFVTSLNSYEKKTTTTAPSNSDHIFPGNSPASPCTCHLSLASSI